MSGRLAALVLALPLLALGWLLAAPRTDVEWKHQPSHFWLVLGAALVCLVLGVLASESTRQRDDDRLFLVSLTLLVAAGFLALHAVATPGVVLEHPTTGFTIATPVGLLLASLPAAASAGRPDRWLRARQHRRRVLRGGVIAVIAVWAVASIAELAPLDAPPPTERAGWLMAVAPVGVIAYLIAAAGYWRLYCERRRPVPLAVAVAFVLLAEALVAVAFGRSWHASWWEWHLLMTAAFVVILLAVRRERLTAPGPGGVFGGIYLARTLELVDRRHAAALDDLTNALRTGSIDGTRERLAATGFGSDELAALEHSARELERVDALLRTNVGPALADQLGRRSELSGGGSVQREVTSLFADLAGFTSFAEARPASEVVSMLNATWEAVVPAISAEGGLIEQFAGDGIVAVFNALDDQPDHPQRAARAALDLQERSAATRSAHVTWPPFRVGINTGQAAVGLVGVATQRSFATIGDTPNVAARLQTSAHPGTILVAAETATRLPVAAVLEPAGAVAVRGRNPVAAFVLRAMPRGPSRT